MGKHDEVLIALRQIIRAIDMHPSAWIKEAGLTSPQLLLLKGDRRAWPDLHAPVGGSHQHEPATATTIMDRLRAASWYSAFAAKPTNARCMRRSLTRDAPCLPRLRPLAGEFHSTFQALENWEQGLLLSSRNASPP